jgi:NhaP-type Na+/H+ or K+/H+ antiporter
VLEGEEDGDGAHGDDNFSAIGKDFGWLVCLYVLLNVIRFVTHLVILPLLRNTGYGFSWKDIVVSTYGALRGAVGLALALFLTNNPEFDQRY